MLSLNESAWQLADTLAADAERLNISITQQASGPRIIDCGVKSVGGLEAGRRLAEICLAGYGRVAIAAEQTGLSINVRSDVPIVACMGAQYAGWQVTGEKFFAMGSGPMRSAAAREPLLAELGFQERASRVVGVLESAKLPTPEVCQKIAADCGVEPANVTLLVARTASIAGAVQVTARSLETALHKLHSLGYELKNIVSGFGAAPLLPIAADDIIGIGRTNDSILYGGHVTLFVRDGDARLAEIGPRVPSSASHDFGEPFAEIFTRYNRDFYKIDPLLFSPAKITFNNLSTGSSQTFGQLHPDILEHSLRN